MARIKVGEHVDGVDAGPVRVMNPNARKFTIIDSSKHPGPEEFEGKKITWLYTFDVKKEPGETRQVPFRIKVRHREAGRTYVIKKGDEPAVLLDENQVLYGDPSIGMT